MRFLKLATFAAAVVIPATLVLAQSGPPVGGPPFGNWRFIPPYGYYSGTQVDHAQVDAAVKEALGKATKGEAWSNAVGMKLTPILVGNQTVGELWQDADLKALAIGSYWAGPFGINVQLVKDGAVVGMLWVWRS